MVLKGNNKFIVITQGLYTYVLIPFEKVSWSFLWYNKQSNLYN